MVEFNRKSAARDALRMVSGKSLSPLDELMNNPAKFLAGRGHTMGKESPEWMSFGPGQDWRTTTMKLGGSSNAMARPATR